MDACTKLLKEVEQLRREKSELENQVKDLDERLTNIFKLDAIAQNQELITLKSNLALSLKLTHNDYKALLDVPLSQDSYAFAKASMTHIFKILKRFDIQL